LGRYKTGTSCDFERTELRLRRCQHILWTIQLRPVRKGLNGDDVNLFESIDTSAFKAVAESSQAQNSSAFSQAYRVSLESCYACHKSLGMPYLRQMVPTAPAQMIINFDGAAWPQ
jgi:hypothetical protein